MGDFAAIIPEFEAQLELEPNDALSLVVLSLAQAHTGASDEARASASRAEAIAQGDPVITLLAANSYAILGDTTAALERIARVEAEDGSGAVAISSGTVAMIYASLGDRDRAFHWLDRAYEEFDSIVFCLHYPEFRPLRADPRFGRLLDRLGLPREAYP
jgi:tetratricopeptide (TPR) repeat protein